MGNSRTTATFGELKGQIGLISYDIKSLLVSVPRRVAQAAVVVQYVGQRGRLLAARPTDPYYVPSELVKDFASYAGEAGLTTLKIRVIVNPEAALRKQTQRKVTMGSAFLESNKAEIYWKNIYWQKGDSAVRQTFLSVVAHEVGHLVHYRAVGDSIYYSLPRVEREYAAERFVGLVLGQEYIRPVQEQFYKGY